MSGFHVERIVAEHPWIARYVENIDTFYDAKVARIDTRVLSEYGYRERFERYWLVSEAGKCLNIVSMRRTNGAFERIFSFGREFVRMKKEETVLQCIRRTQADFPNIEIVYVLFATRYCAENHMVLYKIPRGHTMTSWIAVFEKSAANEIAQQKSDSATT